MWLHDAVSRGRRIRNDPVRHSDNLHYGFVAPHLMSNNE